MKKLAIVSVIWMLLAGCSDRELTSGTLDEVPTESSFMSVSIMSAGTRADYEEGDGTYRDGSEDENAVSSVLFLFFGNDNKPVNSIYDSDKQEYVSYYLWDYDGDNKQNPNHGETVEKRLKTVIEMRFPRKDNTVVKPTQVFTVVNPTSDMISGLAGKTLGELQKIVSDYETGLQDANFVMTTSVYVDDNKKVVNTTAIKETNFQSTAELAAQPDYVVTIYVERILARIDLKIGLKGSTTLKDDDGNDYNIYDTGDDFPDGVVDGDDKNIYVRFLGWNVFDTPNMSRLIKDINAGWEDYGPLGEGNPWNVALYHRSFWAINPPANTPDFEYKRGAFMAQDDEKDGDKSHGEAAYKEWFANANTIPAGDNYSIAYFQENAAPEDKSVETTADKSYDDNHKYVPGAPVQPSKVVLAAQLVDATGKVYDLAKWGGEYFTWEHLKGVICGRLDLYYENGTKEDKDTGNLGTVYSQIKPEHLDYKSNEGSNTVSVVLTEDAAKKKWYKGTNETDIELFDGSVADIEKYINEDPTVGVGKNSIRVWAKGYTYYYFTIQHLGAEGTPGYYGVVRNHIYDATVTSLKGPGISIPDAKEIIVPAPDEETGVLAARVRILSWRVVSQSYELNW